MLNMIGEKFLKEIYIRWAYHQDKMTLVKIILCIFLSVWWEVPVKGQSPDTSFSQPLSIKYSLSKQLAGSRLKKVIIDYNDRVYVLTDKGLGRVQGHQVVKDLLYRPLAGKTPVDITTQEGTGDLYYLFDSCYLSNTDAGQPFSSVSPGKYDQIAVSRDSSVLLAGKGGLELFKDNTSYKISSPRGEPLSVQPYQNTFYVLYVDGLYQVNDLRLKRIIKEAGVKTFTFKKDKILLGTANGYYGILPSSGKIVLPLQTKIPVQNIGELMAVHGRLWAATGRGAFMKKKDGGFRYYASRRWLNEDSVVSMTSDPAGNIFLLTSSGLNEIKFTKMTLSQKAKYFQHITRERHIRYGLLAEVRMKKPGDLSTAAMIDTDNDGLWTSFYLGSQAFRYAATGSPQAARYCWESFAAYERLLTITSVKGFPARSLERTGVTVSDPAAWRPSPDSGWQWKGTTSSDEFVGYIFVAALMNQFVAQTKPQKKRVADFIDKILTHIIKHDLNFVDVNGEPTLWGRWNPHYINGYPKTISDRKLGSTDIIAGLELGYALTRKKEYKKEAYKLMYKKGYLDNIMINPYNIKTTPGYIYKGHDMGEGGWNHSDDEMEFLSYWVLYHYAFTPSLQKKFGEAIKAYWQIERPEKNPVWNLITLGTEGSCDKADVLWYLRQFPLDTIEWTIKNSDRKDLTFLKPNFRHQYTKEVISPAERPVHRYNANEFQLDGGDGGKTALGGAEYLLPYWMARYSKVIR